jgi:hypothetical protein
VEVSVVICQPLVVRGLALATVDETDMASDGEAASSGGAGHDGEGRRWEN